MFGRSDQCDFVLEHPSISRFHAGISSLNFYGIYVLVLTLAEDELNPILIQLYSSKDQVTSLSMIWEAPMELLLIKNRLGKRQRNSCSYNAIFFIV